MPRICCGAPVAPGELRGSIKAKLQAYSKLFQIYACFVQTFPKKSLEIIDMTKPNDKCYSSPGQAGAIIPDLKATAVHAAVVEILMEAYSDPNVDGLRIARSEALELAHKIVCTAQGMDQ
jgi:hypothetical protein